MLCIVTVTPTNRETTNGAERLIEPLMISNDHSSQRKGKEIRKV